MNEMRPSPVRSGASVAVALIFVLVLLFAINWAGSFLKPFALALFIIAVTWPLKSRLQRFMPSMLALALTLLSTIIIFFAFTMLVVWGFSRVATTFIGAAWQLQVAYQELTGWLSSKGITAATSLNDVFNVGLLVRTLQQITGQASTTLSFWLVVLAYVALGLAELDALRGKIDTLHNPQMAETMLRVARATSRKFARYMLVRTEMSALTGFLFWAVATILGLDYAVEWGVIAFALNYIPFIGSVIATVFPAAYGVIQFEHWQTALALFICLNLIQFTIGNYVEPLVSGSLLSISPFMVVFSIFFWTFMWGLFGTFLGVPIAIALLTICEETPSLAWLARLFGRAPPAETPAQRAVLELPAPDKKG
ncbi:AI-2E family transporter [Martelella sp. HB161492]|uniref:AI-2E family transporter n=1 Tax=Martelella sp. HB161492 TaxID=2720726 RepID=UPI001FEEFDB5|nr:AI-2E family transporter [Martelella sp. HB161492]